MHHTHVVCVFVCYFNLCFVLSQSLAWDKHEAKFGVDECPKTLIRYTDLVCLCLVLHLKNRYFFILLIFSFIYDLVGKLVQLEAYWRLEEGDVNTLLQRCDVPMSQY